MRRVLSALTILMATAWSVPAFAQEKDDFEERVRVYLLTHPEVILEALDVLAKREAEAAFRDRLAGFPGLFEAQSSLGMGDMDAPFRVIEYFDYKCGPCKAMHPELKALVAAHPELRIEMRHLPILSPASERAARFALATRLVAGEAAYGRVHAALWEMRGPMNDAGFARIAEAEGLDFATISERMDDDAIEARIDGNRDLAIALEIRGTPAFVTPDSVRFGRSDIDELAAGWLLSR